MLLNSMPNMANKFDSVPNTPNNNIGISTSDETITFNILTDQEANEQNYPLPLLSINGYLMNYEPKINSMNSPYASGYDNLNPVRIFYITSHNLGTCNTINLKSNRSII